MSSKSRTREMSSLVNSIPALRWAKAWKESVGPVLFDKLEYLGISDGILYLSVNDPAWRQDLSYQKDEILKKFQSQLLKVGFKKQEIPRKCLFSPKPFKPFKPRHPQL